MIQSPDMTPSGSGAQKAGVAGVPRGPIKQVRLLLPVWGEQFIAQFLRVSLPTLVAPGNLPAVAAAVPCKFVILTNTEGARLLREHPAISYLRGICEVEFDIIDDLITGENYSMTLTLAYVRAVRAVGDTMCDTGFYFLISDYIMADGSLFNVWMRLQSGHDGVLAGNFQVVEEEAKEALFETFETRAAAIPIPPRSLMAWALNYLHPMTLANTVNFPIYHSAHSNRLFWQVDANTLVGRFYLMHMIAIRPEVREFQIGSSCDYSFIPEMCPSGNVHVMTDSDEYLVVEMQPRTHEERFIRLGNAEEPILAAGLSEWTTLRHRMNAHFPVIYRAGESSSILPEMIRESGRFIESIEVLLPAPQPYRGHPYWLSAIAAHRREVNRRQTAGNPSGPSVETPDGYHDFLFRLRGRLLGRGSQVPPWHPQWPDYWMVGQLIEKHIPHRNGRRLLTISSKPAIFEDWPKVRRRITDSLPIAEIFEASVQKSERVGERYDSCLIVLVGKELRQLPRLLRQIRHLLLAQHQIVVFLINSAVGLDLSWRFNQDVLDHVGTLADGSLSFSDVKFVKARWSAWAAVTTLRGLFERSLRSPLYFLPAGILIAAVLLLCVVGNLLRRLSISRARGGGVCSSIGMALHVKPDSPVRPERSVFSELDLAERRYNAAPKPASDPTHLAATL